VKHSVIFLLFFVIVTKANSQSKDHIITHQGDTIIGEIKTKSVYGVTFYKVTSILKNGKKEKTTVYPSSILKMKKGYSTFVEKWVDDSSESSLFDERDKRRLKDQYLWKVEYQSIGSVPNGLGGSVMTSSTSISYYLEDPKNEGHLEYIPSGKRSLAEFLREKGCIKVAKGVETGYLDHKDMRLVLEEYLDRCQ
jgi:hypothetical protein